MHPIWGFILEFVLLGIFASLVSSFVWFWLVYKKKRSSIEFSEKLLVRQIIASYTLEDT